jgi:hypothetical protein
MNKNSFGKIKSFLLVILSVALIITGFQLYQNNQESQRQFESFLNQFYFKLESAISSVDSILEQPSEGNDLEQSLLQLDRDLEQTDLILNAGYRLIDREIYGHTFLFSNHPINHFADNNRLTEDELNYLEDLKKDLKTIQMGLYSDETGQENRNLSIQRFNDIIRGAGDDSDFLTQHQSVKVPFQVIVPEEAPERIQKWLERNATGKQNKVFLAEGKTYVVIVGGKSQNGSNRVEITDMALKRSGVDVTHQTVQSDDASNFDAVAIAELKQTELSFQFTASVETKSVRTDDVSESTNIADAQYSSAQATVELVQPEKLSEYGRIVND